MKDFLGNPLNEGDIVAIYWGYNALQTATIVQVKGRKVKVDVDGTISKWKDGSCMVKLPD
ncbi:hypothetical protein P1A145kb_p054 [Pectobacterium phage DU_PP_I]|nr:hypothetical protein P1A145kb_p054 [Pectobacterium phage DU_PP_I]ATS93770.1 hypothetical protein P12B145kb_p054 [Pectobacterium phage DU_PP_IV]